MNLPSDSVVVMWGLMALACLTAVGMGIRQEGRWFAERGKRRSWLALRICSIPIAISTAGLLVLVTRSAGGPSSLMALYIMLFTVAPFAYFAQHWITGRWLTPRLSAGESAWIGFSGLLAVAAPPALIVAFNPWLQDAAGVLDILF